ncbi:MAG: hypothetical protein F6K31_42245 [Symploca sp. SIO2G7]|nr:hypothetical protein [Symploca sp. SIO2G7]
MDGEIGRFEFMSYTAVDSSGKAPLNRVNTLYGSLPGKRWYRTVGFKEIAYTHGSTIESYRKTSQWLNRIRHQETGGTPSRTMQDSSEREGIRVLNHLTQTSEAILKTHGVVDTKLPASVVASANEREATHLAPETVSAVIEQCGKTELIRQQMTANPIPYEDPHHSLNISIDDVGVKRQSEQRPASVPETPTTRKYAYQTVVHIENQLGSYRLNALGLTVMLTMLLAFLLHNDLLQGPIVVFADGQRSLHGAILTTFAGVSALQLILDWYHLHEKCKQLLSLACQGRRLRNTHLTHLAALLWHGLVDAALVYLEFIDPDHLKDTTAIDKLKGYLHRNKPHIPCYCVRKQLGLRNSSNRGEKANDLLVSSRQKHNGMSWSKTGSVALTALTALVSNQEATHWFRTGQLNFKLVPHPVK